MSGQPVPGVSGDAETIARALAESGRPWFWLDGSAAPEGEDRVSYLGTASEVLVSVPGREREFLETLRGDRSRPEAEGTAPSVGFHDGWVVALSYEFGTALMGIENVVSSSEASGIALRVDDVIRIEHGPDTGPGNGTVRPAAPAPRVALPVWRRSDAAYRREVEACREAIRDGEAYVLCLTDTAEVPGESDPLELYLLLREHGAATRGGVIVAGERALVSASPERFLGVRSRRIETHPIKGTRPRGATPDEDARLAAELAADPKERAENLMIVDLMRNDLSRVCVPGTVAVEGFLRVESHPHVHQLVSTVSGELAEGRDIFDALEAAFPGGSMTGAPKRRAIEILAGLEEGPRGLYSGSFGWIDAGGDAELAMTIRSVELRERGGAAPCALIGAGGGITADSDPARELAEKHLKAAPLLARLAAVRR